jgi:two-component system chemotaxis response regulator CheY
MPPTVLIVEDGDSAAPLEIALASIRGVTIQIASNGRDALKFLGTSSLELAAVVTDLHLPYVDGFELIANIRTHERYSRLPIIVVSGDSRPDTPERVRNLGANAFFPKPYSPADIRHKLEGLLDVH